MKKTLLTAAVLVLTAGVALLAVPGPRVRAQQVASIALPPPGATTALYEGCNNIALTFPDRTPVGHPHPGWTTQSVVDAIEPPAPCSPCGGTTLPRTDSRASPQPPRKPATS